MSAQEPEESAYLLIELGADGVWHEDQDTLRAYFKGSSDELSNFEKKADSLGFKIIKKDSVEDKNWLQNCREIWQPVQADGITITPVLSLAEKPDRARAPKEIFLIPGSGFGTGHHATTRLVIGFMQSDYLHGFAPKTAIDVGTGSGVLALAATELFNCPVKAIDNDADAIENAIDNIKLNGKETTIEALVECAEVVKGHFDLVVANIYAEFLIKLVSQFKTLLNPDGFLILSGIVRPLADDVRKAFTHAGFCCLEQREEGEWVGLLFRP